MDSLLPDDWLCERIDRHSSEPMYRQLYRLIQQSILTGELAAGIKLPSSRTLAHNLQVARNTVTHVYEQLLVEGYVKSSTGSGTYVADTTPDQLVGVSIRQRHSRKELRQLSTRGQRTVKLAGASKQQWGAFMPGVPDVSEFPAKIWSRIFTRIWRRPNPDLMTYATGGGYRPLRHILADYLRTTRSVNCRPEQVIITTGTHQSVDLAVRLLSDAGDKVWMENPCYWGLRSVLHSSGLEIVPVPVDSEGMNPGPRHLAEPPRFIIATPSHQYPLGMVTSLMRRRTLLEYARRHRCWIIEDDYDSEFRFGSRPLASLQGLDIEGQVIYVGSFGKTLFPGLRIGYMVVPDDLAERFAIGLAELYREGQLVQQAALAEFIEQGHFGSHVRRMRNLYAERRSLLISAIDSRYGASLPVMGDQAGLHLVLGLPSDSDDRRISSEALERGVVARPLSTYYHTPVSAQQGLLLGYACVPDKNVAPCFRRLAEVIDRNIGNSR